MTAPNTQRNRARAFDRFLQRFGQRSPVSELEDRNMRRRLYDWRDTFAAHPAEGNNTIQTVSTLLNWAVDRGLTRDNPAAGMKSLGPRRRSRAEIVWEPDQIRAFLKVSTRPVAEVFLMGLWTGLRESDILSLTTTHFGQGWITLRPKKTARSTGNIVMIPYHLSPVLAPMVTELVTMPWLPGQPILRNRIGAPWQLRTFHRAFTGAKADAGLGGLDLTFHDLRGTFVTWLVEAECTDAEIASLTGHAIGRGSIRSYAARTRALAENAYSKLIRKGEAPYDVGNHTFFIRS